MTIGCERADARGGDQPVMLSWICAALTSDLRRVKWRLWATVGTQVNVSLVLTVNDVGCKRFLCFISRKAHW
jgi:hypothetical protein